jgi:NADPH:quinone reductase-like Zn-dependent oxidoreductase
VGEHLYGATADFGAYAEYICLPEDGALSTIPANISFAEAAAVPGGALTALPFLRDEGKIKAGDKVLINGASGSVGSYGVQLAKHFGAHVTGVCSTRNLEMVKSLGADDVIDYTQEDFTRSRDHYDIIFDAAGKSSFARSKRSLKQGGRFLAVAITPSILWHSFWTRWFGNKRARLAFTGLRPAADQAQDLRWLSELLAAGALKPVIGTQMDWRQIAEAHRLVDAGHKQGNLVITVP